MKKEIGNREAEKIRKHLENEKEMQLQELSGRTSLNTPDLRINLTTIRNHNPPLQTE